MSSGQSLRNGSSVEPGLPKTFLMPNARSSSKVACLTVVAFGVFADKAFPQDDCYLLAVIPGLAQRARTRHLELVVLFPHIEIPGSVLWAAPERRRLYHQLAVLFMVGCPSAFAVHSSSPPLLSSALT